MAIQKQEFYEGAALHRLARFGSIKNIRYEPPFFIVNDGLLIHLKYSTKGRSPWGFTFMPDEQVLMQKMAKTSEMIIGLICGADGVAAFNYEDWRTMASPRDSAVHIACYRKHWKHYEVCGPDGILAEKVAPSKWERILER